ncbi:MAG: hypothetical protein KatS3mg081_2148 [Gemmatimonadales bacterium]|nr:MAG: hypothetical protein KatS3mg081_2148 [Gemmatimonadales bacterium]
MEKPHRIAQLYGYAVCLVPVITFIISAASLVGATFDLSDPLHASGFGVGPREPSLAAFDNFGCGDLRGKKRQRHRPLQVQVRAPPAAASRSLPDWSWAPRGGILVHPAGCG